jgi:hypothetical protein
VSDKLHLTLFFIIPYLKTMKLIYLDTSNFSLLTSVKSSEPQKYDDFLKKWKQRNFTLAYTNAHLDELLRLEIADSRDARFKVLEDLLPFRFENRRMEKEFMLALIAKKIIEPNIGGIDLLPQIFSQRISNTEDLNLLKGFNADFYRTIIDDYHAASGLSWDASTQGSKSKNDKLPRLSDLSDTTTTHEMMKPLIDAIESMGDNPVAEIMRKFVDKAKQTSYREAFSELIGANPSNAKTQKKSLDWSLKEFYFGLHFKNFITGVLEVNDSEEIQRLESLVNLKDCSGFWLSEQVKTQLVLAKDSKASNEKDIKHISHLPYVDVFLTDRRITSATIQVLRKKDLIESLKGITQPISVSNNLESLEKALFL